MSDRFQEYLKRAHEGASLDDVFELKVTAGGVRWWRQEAREARDEAIRRLADRYFGGLDLHDQADAIRTAIVLYQGGRWQHDRKCGMPEHYAGTRDELLYEAFRRGGGNVPESRKQLLRILSVS